MRCPASSSILHPLDSPLLPGEPEVENRTSVRRGTITFVYQQPLWPNLAFETGGLFERLLADQRGDGVSSDTTVTRLRPFANLRWRTPLYLGELSWARNGTRAGGGGPDVEITRETYGANLGWYPTTTDFLRIAYTHNTDRDQPRSRLDRQGDVLGASATYQPFRTLRIDLSGSDTRQEDHIRRIRTESQAARGRLNYADAFWTGRFSVAGSYDASWNRSKFLGTEPGAEVELPVTAIQGLSVVSDLPAAVTLAANPGLIDQDRLAATGLNIGLIPPSGDRRPRNAGLDFGIAKRVNVLRVWVDRDLPRAISATFSWEIWTSSDNLRWAREHNLPSAPFGPVDFFLERRVGTIE